MDDIKLAMVAKLHYVDKVKQKKIADMFNTSPMVISRMIKDAEDRGIINIDIRTPVKINLRLSKVLKEKYDLRDCVVVENTALEEGVESVAKFLAEYVICLLPKDGVLGVSWGRTIERFAENLKYQNREDCTVLELTGGFYAKNGEMKTPTGIIIKICQRIQADHMVLNAPYYVQTLEAKNALKEDYNNKNLAKLARKANVNIISASPFSKDSTTSTYEVINEADYSELQSLGARGDIAGVFIDKNGDEINWSKHDLYMGVPISELNKAENVICVASGKKKSEIISLAAERRTLFFNILIIDEALAEELLRF